MPVDDAVVVAVHATRDVCLRPDQRAGGVDLLEVAREHDVGRLAAQLEPVRAVPVVAGEGGDVLGPRRPGVDDQAESDDQDDRHDQGEQGAALEADTPALALLGEAGGLLGRRG